MTIFKIMRSHLMLVPLLMAPELLAREPGIKATITDLSGVRLSSSHLMSTPINTPNCHTGLRAHVGTKGLSLLSDDVSGVTSVLSMDICREARVSYARPEERFSVARCNALIVCTEEKMRRLADEDKKRQADIIFRELASKNLAKNFMTQKSHSMEKIEGLKKFAQKKYGNGVGASCASRFVVSKDSLCQLSIVEESFKEHQLGCNQGFGCYNSSDEEKQKGSYKSFIEKYKDENKSPLLSFFEDRVEKKLSSNLSMDNKYLEKLGDLVASNDFKKAKTEEKEEMFIRALLPVEGAADKYYDPVLSFDFNLRDKDSSAFKGKAQFQELKKLFLKNGIVKKDFITQFEAFRKKRAEAHLGKNGECSIQPTIESICSDVSKVRQSEKTAPMQRYSVGNLLNWESYGKDTSEYKVISEIMGDAIQDSTDLEFFLDAERCLSFNFESVPGSVLASRGPAMTFDPREIGQSASRYESYESSSSSSMEETLVGLDLKQPKAESSEALVTKDMETSEIKEAPKAIAQTDSTFDNDSFYNPNAFSNNQFSGKNFFEEAEKTAAKPDAPAPEATKGDEATTANNEKLAELMKKLSATEEKLDKLKAASEEAEEDRIKEKKIQEENAVIADLKSQINELKEKTSRPRAATTVASAPVESSRNFVAPSSNSSFASVSSRPAETKSYSVESFDTVRSSAEPSAPSSPGNSSAQTAARSIASAPILTATNSESNSAAGAMVLTKVDGMTSEKVAETISSKIKELNGVPFLIEEDGVTKKVIPLIKDGRIDLDENGQPKYVKIKVNRKECTEEEFKKSPEKCRAPASVAKSNTSVADEKREEEEKLRRELERAQYLKLKALTNKAMDKK